MPKPVGPQQLPALAVSVLAVWAGASAFAQAPVAAKPAIYPTKGQTDAQQEKDKSDCYTWATKQTGYDPVQALQQQQQQQAQAAQTQQAQPAAAPQGQRAKGAVGGAAGGAAIGAIAGDTGKGAAIGATVGVLAGGAKKRRQEAEQQQAAQQAQQQVLQQQNQLNAAASQKLADYTRNFGACMQGKGYSVK